MISFFMCKVKIKLKNKVIFSCVCQSHTAILTRDKQLIQIIYYTIYVRGLPVDLDVVWVNLLIIYGMIGNTIVTAKGVHDQYKQIFHFLCFIIVITLIIFITIVHYAVHSRVNVILFSTVWMTFLYFGK